MTLFSSTWPARGWCSPAGSLVRAHATTTTATYCYKQPANDNRTAFVSQNFESSMDANDSDGVDDFTFAHRCTIRQVVVKGAYFQAAGPASSVDVWFYAQGAQGGPGTPLYSRAAPALRRPPGKGNLTVVLTMPVTLRPGTSWLEDEQRCQRR